MNCPFCHSRETSKRIGKTDLGYGFFRCSTCCRQFNEPTGTPFNCLEFVTDIVFQVLLCRFRYKLSLGNLAEMFLLRGCTFTYEAVREWEELFAEQLRRERHSPVGRRWFVDEMYVKVKGETRYLYRAVDSTGQTIDFLLAAKRDQSAAKRYFQRAWRDSAHVLSRVINVDRKAAYQPAL